MMNLTIQLEGNLTREQVRVLRALADAYDPATPEPEKDDTVEPEGDAPKPKRKRRTKAEMEAARAAEPEPEPEPEPVRTADKVQAARAEKTEDEVTMSDAIVYAQGLVAHGRGAIIRKVLKAFGVAKAKELDPSRAGEFLAAMQAEAS